jgi:DNA primase
VEKGEAFASLHTEVDKAVNKTNFDLLRRFCIKTLDKCRLESLSTELHVTELSLERLDLGYWRSKGCYMFPLKSPSDKTVGVLRRFNDGKKFLVKGSSIGLYLPTDFHWEPTYTMVAEGGSDTAALLDMGFNAVGRYNVDTCFDLLAELLPGHKVTIIMDNDKDGRGAAGAFALQTYLRSQFVESQILALPSQYKDIREMKRYLGGAKCLSWTLHSLKPLWS